MVEQDNGWYRSEGNYILGSSTNDPPFYFRGTPILLTNGARYLGSSFRCRFSLHAACSGGSGTTRAISTILLRTSINDDGPYYICCVLYKRLCNYPQLGLSSWKGHLQFLFLELVKIKVTSTLSSRRVEGRSNLKKRLLGQKVIIVQQSTGSYPDIWTETVGLRYFGQHHRAPLATKIRRTDFPV